MGQEQRSPPLPHLIQIQEGRQEELQLQATTRQGYTARWYTDSREQAAEVTGSGSATQCQLGLAPDSARLADSVWRCIVLKNRELGAGDQGSALAGPELAQRVRA